MDRRKPRRPRTAGCGSRRRLLLSRSSSGTPRAGHRRRARTRPWPGQPAEAEKVPPPRRLRPGARSPRSLPARRKVAAPGRRRAGPRDRPRRRGRAGRTPPAPGRPHSPRLARDPQVAAAERGAARAGAGGGGARESEQGERRGGGGAENPAGSERRRLHTPRSPSSRQPQGASGAAAAAAGALSPPARPPPLPAAPAPGPPRPAFPPPPLCAAARCVPAPAPRDAPLPPASRGRGPLRAPVVGLRPETRRPRGAAPAGAEAHVGRRDRVCWEGGTQGLAARPGDWGSRLGCPWERQEGLRGSALQSGAGTKAARAGWGGADPPGAAQGAPQPTSPGLGDRGAAAGRRRQMADEGIRKTGFPAAVTAQGTRRVLGSQLFPGSDYN
ncbi:transcription initiation factor TFIID subunit 4-like [Manis pentadactyla]|uniref:transcription initiation factor TFIID subunit 4-like n=1 Tax=Manis pentadactyla TaxID=143292 RepID=UPI00255C7035|nr:transcription initiation factor TFIID subunit 4-like [Manis pentadactyla]